MASIKKFLKKNKIFAAYALIIFLSLTLGAWNLGNAGQVWDEKDLITLGYKQVKLAQKFDFLDDFFWKGEALDHPPLVRYVRGVVGFFDIKEIKDDRPIYNYNLIYNRLISVLLYFFTSVTIFVFGYKLLSYFEALISSIILSMMPIVLGHSQLTMYEPFNLFFYTSSVVSFIFFLNNTKLKNLLVTGILLGLALLSKETNILLIPMFIGLIIIKHYIENKTSIKEIALKTSLIFLISFCLFVAIWPAPFMHIREFVDFQANLRAGPFLPSPEVFFGKLMHVPIFYYYFYTIITTPLLIIFLFIAGLMKINRSKNWILYSLVLWFLLPFVMSFYAKREQGIRYIIQICPPMAIIAAIGFKSFTDFFSEKIKFKIIMSFVLFLYLFVTLAKINPYYIDYFNILVGGTNGVYKNKLFHLGWWGEGLGQAFDYIDRNVPNGSKIGVATEPSHIIPPLSNKIIERYDDKKEYDFVVANYFNILRFGFDDNKIRKNYYPIYIVHADKADLVTVYKRR